MTTLTKDFLAANPGRPGVPATPAITTPGIPPIPPTPAYCVDQVTTVPGVSYIYVTDPGNPLTGRPPGVIVIPVPGPPVNVITHVCHEAVPGVPGVPGTVIPGLPAVPGVPPTPADYNAGWSGAARSVGTLTADGQFEFSVPQGVVGVVTGFNTEDVGTGYGEIQHGIRCESGVFRVIESGAHRTDGASYTTSSVFTIARTGTLVRYFHEGVLVYTSTIPSVGTVFADASLYMGEDKIIDASLTASVDVSLQSFSGDVDGILTGLSGYSGNVTGGVMQRPELGQLVPDIRAYPVGDVHGVLTGLQGESRAVGANATCSGVLGGLVGSAEADLIAPQFALVTGILQQLAGFSLAVGGSVGSVDGVLGGLRGYASNAPGAVIDQGTPLPPGGVDGNGDWPGRTGGQLRLLVGQSFDKTAWDAAYELNATITLPMLETASTAAADTVLSAAIVLPSPLVVEASVLVGANATLPALQAHGSAMFEVLLTADIDLPHPLVLTANILSGALLDAVVLLPRLQATGYTTIGGGLRGGAVLPMLLVSGRSYQELILTGDIRLPRLKAGGVIGAAENYAAGHLILPMLVAGTHLIHAALTLPRLRAAGSILSGVSQQTRLGYAMNISNAALTTFSNFPFRAMVRAYDQYWAIGLDGNLYRLVGDVDDAMPIDWEFESGLANFGVMGQKGVLAAYVDGVFENGATLTLVTDDARRVYSHRAAGNYANHMMHRITTGRGVRTHNIALGMANPKGGYLELDRITPEYVIIPRNL
jgi:hypothetical protein